MRTAVRTVDVIVIVVVVVGTLWSTPLFDIHIVLFHVRGWFYYFGRRRCRFGPGCEYIPSVIVIVIVFL